MVKNILSEIACVFGMTSLILLRIKTVSWTLILLLAVVYLVLSIFFSIKAHRTNSDVTANQEKYLQWLHNCLCCSYGTILILLLL